MDRKSYIVLEREKIQKFIKNTYGADEIKKAKVRLCSNCRNRIRADEECNLLPITSDGHDCFYFQMID